MNEESERESEIAAWLDDIKPVPPRNAQSARRARALFLNQAVSASELRRRTGWKFKFRKEQFAMNVWISIFVVAGLLFGGGATVNAAQDDLPDEPLYGLKLWSEDLSLGFQNNSEEKVNRLMELAHVRVQEMTQINDAGTAVPDQVRLRLEQHIQQALQICSTMDDPTMDRSLAQVRDQLREQDRDMEQLQLRIHQDSQPVLDQTREMLRLRLQLVNDALLDHELFRNAARNGFRYGQDEEFIPPALNGNSQQTGQPTWAPGGPNADQSTQVPGNPNPDPGGPKPDSGGANTTPGGSNTSPGGPNTDPGGNMNGSGSGSGGNSNDSGGNRFGGDDSGGSGGTGGNGNGGGNGP